MEKPWNMSPKHWIPKRKQDTHCEDIKHSKQSHHKTSTISLQEKNLKTNDTHISQIECIEHSIHSQQKKCRKCDDKPETQETAHQSPSQMTPKERIEHSIHSGIQEYNNNLRRKDGNDNDTELEVNEAIESDFLISPGDIYPNRKVMLEDADVSESMKL